MSAFFALALMISTSAQAATPLTFSAALDNDDIGPGNVATLTYTLTNPDAVDPAANVAFSLSLPAGVTLASPANGFTTCTDAVLLAFDGGTTVDLSDGRLGTTSVCTVTVDVTSAAVASHAITTGDLTSSSGNSGTATTTLTVNAAKPGVALSFSPNPVPLNGITTMTLSFDFSANTGIEPFNINVPLGNGLKVASLANASHTCLTGTVSATPGASAVSFFGAVNGSAVCEMTVDIQAELGGIVATTTGQLFDNLSVGAGKASALVDVTVSPLNLGAFFVDDPVPPGGTVTLEYIITNFHPSDATDLAFTDDLDATLSGLTAISLPAAPCGAGSTLTGTSTLTLAGGTLASGGSCTFSVTLQVPGAASPGAYVNTTTVINATIGGMSVTGNAGTDTLDVRTTPSISKSYVGDPTAAGGSVTVEYTITNTNTASPATDITFVENLDSLIPGITVTMLPTAGFCGAGATLIAGLIIPPFSENGLQMTGGSLAAGDSCSFQVTLQLAADSPHGAHTSTTGGVTATIGGTDYTGLGATDTLIVVTAPRLAMSFTDDPVAPGGTTTLEFTLSFDENAPGDATNVSFDVDLDGVITGMVATGLPANDVCGIGSQLSGTSTISLTGATVSPNDSCTFSVTVQVPATATPTSHAVASSSVTGIALGVVVTSAAASDALSVSGVVVTKEFVDDPVVPGGVVSLRYSITNAIPGEALTNIAFTDDLGTVLSGLVATALPLNGVCGAGSQLSGTDVITLTAGQLADGGSCTFTINLQVPAGASAGKYPSVTSAITADTSGGSVSIDPVGDTLIIGDPLMFSAQFTDDPVRIGSTVTLEFTIANADPSNAATGLTFTDDLGAALAGMAASGLPVSDVCGAGSELSGSDVITLTGGNIAAGGMCTFSVSVQLPDAASPGFDIVNTTSELSGTINGNGTSAPAASDSLIIDFATLTKAFASTGVPGNTTTLTFTIENHSTAAIADISFLDDLSSMGAGFTAVTLPASGFCGAGSEITGSDTIVVRNANLAGGATCTFDVDLLVAKNVDAGDYVNTTDEPTAGGQRLGPAATATLTVAFLPPEFTKAFAPATIDAGATTTLTFTIDNSAAGAPVSDLSFTDNLPAGVSVADPASASTTCTGGTITAVAGGNTIGYSGGTVAATSSCEIQVNVTANEPGTYTNTTEELTSSAGSSGTATATLTVNAAEPADDDGGCCDASSSSGRSSALLALLVFVLLARRRKTGPC